MRQMAFSVYESFPSKGQWDGREAHDGHMTETPEKSQTSAFERKGNMAGKWLVLKSHNGSTFVLFLKQILHL